MAIVMEAARTWVHEATEYNIRSADGAVRSDGQIVLTWSGIGSTMDGMVKIGLLNETSHSVTDVTTTLYPHAGGRASGVGGAGY